MGAFKWQALGPEYRLSKTPAPTDAQVSAAPEIFRGAGCRANMHLVNDGSRRQMP
jgi:hypothetical protein